MLAKELSQSLRPFLLEIVEVAPRHHVVTSEDFFRFYISLVPDLFMERSFAPAVGL
jgi:hypothetical protein